MLPQLPFTVLCWDFYNSRFVNDSSSAVSPLYNTNNPGLVAFLFFNILAEGGRLFSRQGYE